MGRKRQQTVAYDQKAMENLAFKLKCFRRPIRDGALPEINIDVEKLETAVHELPKKQREPLERFYGLIPGTTLFESSCTTRSNKDIAYQNMMEAGLATFRCLTQFEHLQKFDENVAQVVQGLATKIDKTGAGEISDEDAIKYLLILVVFFANGPRMIFEEPNYKINLEQEDQGHFDEFALLNTIWNQTGKRLPDQSINLKLLLEAISMLNVRDVVAMKRFVRLPVEKDFEDLELPAMYSFKDVRLFKERVFGEGGWDITTWQIYGTPEGDMPDFTKFAKNYPKFRKDWQTAEEFRTGTKTVELSTGEKEMPLYEIGGLEFTDLYEVMFLYLSRNLL